MPYESLAAERYVSLETFKKDGTGVKTPIWVAGLDGKLVAVTDGTSWKVKRLRRNPKVRVAKCDARGKVSGAFEDGEARVVDDPARVERIHQELKRKYGWQFWGLDAFSWLGRRMARRAWLEIEVGTVV